MRFGAAGNEVPAVVLEGKYYDLRALTPDINGKFLEQGGSKIAKLVDEGLKSGALVELRGTDTMRVGAPIARPAAVLCIGQNYAAHAAESGAPRPSVPILFFKHPNTIVGPYDDVCIPRGATAVDWEVELGVVIGQQARYLNSAEEAIDYIVGFAISNDVSERNFQIEESGGQWSKGKCAETFNPLGPQLVTVDEVESGDLRLWSRVNGEARQDSNTSDMIFNVAEIVHDLSQYVVLEPGDLINTGTPQGVALSGRFPYLRAGDVVELGIDGLGEPQRQILKEA